MALEPKLLLLDEPLGGLSGGEIPGMVALTRRLRDAGLALILVEHHMRVARPIASWSWITASRSRKKRPPPSSATRG